MENIMLNLEDTKSFILEKVESNLATKPTRSCVNNREMTMEMVLAFLKCYTAFRHSAYKNLSDEGFRALIRVYRYMYNRASFQYPSKGMISIRDKGYISVNHIDSLVQNVIENVNTADSLDDIFPNEQERFYWEDEDSKYMIEMETDKETNI